MAAETGSPAGLVAGPRRRGGPAAEPGFSRRVCAEQPGGDRGRRRDQFLDISMNLTTTHLVAHLAQRTRGGNLREFAECGADAGLRPGEASCATVRGAAVAAVSEGSIVDHPTANSGCVVSEMWHGSGVVISASGVLDMLTAPQLEASVTAALAKNPSTMIIDLTDVDFLASAGMAVLVAARDRAEGNTGFGVVASGPATSRPLTLVGLAERIGLYPTLAEARAALGE